MHNSFFSLNPIGIDLSDTAIKIAQLNSKRQIKFLNKISLPEGVIVNGEIIKGDEAVKAIKKLLKSSGKVSTNEAACALPERLTYFKNIEIEKNHNPNFYEEIEAEIAKHLPEEPEKLYIDWQILNKKNKLNNESLKIIIGAGPKKIVDKYINVLENSGLTPISMEIESMAIARALLNPNDPAEKNKTIGILDIGSTASTFIIVNNNTVRFTFSLSLSSEKITNLISDTLNIDNEQAEKAKILCGLDAKKAKGAIKKILDSLMCDLTETIKQIENFYINYFNGKMIDKIFLCGGTANLQSLDETIQKLTQKEIMIGNPLINLKEKTKDIKIVKQQGLLSYITSIGLLIDESINLER